MGIARGAKILVTGGTGFLGSYIIRELVQNGYAVRAIRRSRKIPFYIPAAVTEKVEWVQGDVLDVVSIGTAMEGVDAVIHSAAMVSFRPKERREMYQVNIQGTANMVNLALEKGIGRFIHISSVAALGRSATGQSVNEADQWAPFKANTHYSASKYHAEMEVWRAMGEGLDGVILNPSTILGFGDWNDSSCAIFKSVYSEFPWYTEGINGFVDVEDVARSAQLLMAAEISGERFLINGDNWSFRQLFNSIADGFGRKRPWREAGPILSGLAWRLEKIKSLFTGRAPLLNRETARIARSRSFFDNSKILGHLPGFQFTPLEESIPRICRSYLDRLAGQ